MSQIRPLLILLSLVFLHHCKLEENLPEIGMNFAGPIAIDTDKDHEYFYVLNSDYERTYNTASIRIVPVDDDPEKHTAVTIPRMGKILKIIDDTMFIAYDRARRDELGRFEIWDLSTDKTRPEKKWSLNIDCSPLSLATEKDYPYFALSCASGDLWMGTLTDPLEDSQLKLTRSYSFPRRAMVINTKRDLLFAFPSDSGALTYTDQIYNDDLQGPNEIPDSFEDGQFRRRTSHYKYQFIVYDIAAEKEKDFAFNELDDFTNNHELRWTYFKLTDSDGIAEGEIDDTQKYYRTNFYEAKNDPSIGDSDSFFLSHRGNEKSPHANNIIRVTIKGDPRIIDGKIPLTSDFLSFQRIYGFRNLGEVDDIHYPSQFQLIQVANENLLIANHFRAPKYWKSDERRFSISAKSLSNNGSVYELTSTKTDRSYYQIAATPSGKSLTCSFYGSSVFLLDIKPGEEILEIRHIF